MIKQQVVFTDAYGITIEPQSISFEKKQEYNTINEYCENGWIIKNVQGTGISSQNFTTRGSFCFVIEKNFSSLKTNEKASKRSIKS